MVSVVTEHDIQVKLKHGHKVPKLDIQVKLKHGHSGPGARYLGKN